MPLASQTIRRLIRWLSTLHVHWYGTLPFPPERAPDVDAGDDALIRCLRDTADAFEAQARAAHELGLSVHLKYWTPYDDGPPRVECHRRL